LRFSLSYRDAEELLAERGLLVDHVHRLEVGLPIIYPDIRLDYKLATLPPTKPSNNGLPSSMVIEYHLRRARPSPPARRFLVSGYRGRIMIAKNIVLIQFALFA
jgi:hypothetical protein